MENRPLSWFLAQRRQSLQQENLDQKLESRREAIQKRDAENTVVRERNSRAKKARHQDLRLREALSSIRLVEKAAQRSKRLLSDLSEEFVHLADELIQKTRKLENLVSKAKAKDIEDATEEPKTQAPQYPRVV